MKITSKLVLLFLILSVIAACSPQSQATPTLPPPATATQTRIPPTETKAPTQAPLMEATQTEIPATQAATETLIPSPTATIFPGFADNFKFYQAWTKGETTYFYFMSAYVDQTVFALVDDLEGATYPLTCPQDGTYPQDLRCYSEELFKGKKDYKVTFFTDPEHQHPFRELNVATNLDTSYLTYDNCEKEYRLYDGKCYAGITCYGENGEVIYSYDDIPDNGNFEGFTLPCW